MGLSPLDTFFGSIPFLEKFMAAVVNAEKCTGCETCVDSCPLDAISMKDGLAVIDPDTCGDCGACVDVCPVEAISID
jgi:ferredoxin